MPPLSLDGLTVLAEWIEGPLLEACGAGPLYDRGEQGGAEAPSRARPAWPSGIEGWRPVEEEHPVAQDDGFLTPRHTRC